MKHWKAFSTFLVWLTLYMIAISTGVLCSPILRYYWPFFCFTFFLIKDNIRCIDKMWYNLYVNSKHVRHTHTKHNKKQQRKKNLTYVSNLESITSSIHLCDHVWKKSTLFTTNNKWIITIIIKATDSLCTHHTIQECIIRRCSSFI